MTCELQNCPCGSEFSKEKKSIYVARKFKVRKSTSHWKDRLQEVQEVSKTFSGVGFGQQAQGLPVVLL